MVAGSCDMIDHQKDNIAIIVGSSNITTDRLKNDIKFMKEGIEMPEQQKEQLRDLIIEQCINHYLIMEFGKTNDITLSEKELQDALKDVRKEYTDAAFDEALLRGYVDFDQWKNRLKEQLLEKKIIKNASINIAITNYEDIKQYYELHQDKFRFPKMIEFRQIVTRTKEDAKKLLKRLHKGEQLEDLAVKHSSAPEAENGGYVGWVAKGNLNESMGKVLFSIPKNKISSVVKTPYGYHIFEVLSVRPAGLKPLSDAIKEIKAKILLKKREEFTSKWLQNLRNTFEVKINKSIINNLELS